MPPQRKSNSPSKSETPLSPPSKSWVDHLGSLQTHFGRFLWDILGVSLLAFALMTILGELGLSKGNLLVKWVLILRTWFGWGEILVVLSIGCVGLFVFRRS